MKWFYRGAYTLHGTVNLNYFSKSLRTAFVKNCPQQYPIDFAIRWACKRNRENSYLSAYHYHHSVNHGMMICVLFIVVFFTVCTTVDWV